MKVSVNKEVGGGFRWEVIALAMMLVVDSKGLGWDCLRFHFSVDHQNMYFADYEDDDGDEMMSHFGVGRSEYVLC